MIRRTGFLLPRPYQTVLSLPNCIYGINRAPYAWVACDIGARHNGIDTANTIFPPRPYRITRAAYRIPHAFLKVQQ